MGYDYLIPLLTRYRESLEGMAKTKVRLRGEVTNFQVDLLPYALFHGLPWCLNQDNALSSSFTLPQAFAVQTGCACSQAFSESWSSNIKQRVTQSIQLLKRTKPGFESPALLIEDLNCGANRRTRRLASPSACAPSCRPSSRPS